MVPNPPDPNIVWTFRGGGFESTFRFSASGIDPIHGIPLVDGWDIPDGINVSIYRTVDVAAKFDAGYSRAGVAFVLFQIRPREVCAIWLFDVVDRTNAVGSVALSEPTCSDDYDICFCPGLPNWDHLEPASGERHLYR